MTTPATPDRTAAKRTTDKKVPARRNPHRFQGGTSEANRIAVAILEVLAGSRSPAEAATALKAADTLKNRLASAEASEVQPTAPSQPATTPTTARATEVPGTASC